MTHTPLILSVLLPKVSSTLLGVTAKHTEQGLFYLCVLDPGDAMKSSVDDITTDFTKVGAFRFVVVLKDRFNNLIKVIQRINKNPTPISVQYSSKAKPQSLRFLRCTTTVRNNGAGDEYVLSCEGAEKEDIFFYPSMNNVPLGGKDKYEAKTTLCPGKNSCKGIA